MCCSGLFSILANDFNEVHSSFYILDNHEDEISNEIPAAKLLSRLAELGLCIITILPQQLSEAF